jgi:hypothetical protein
MRVAFSPFSASTRLTNAERSVPQSSACNRQTLVAIGFAEALSGPEVAWSLVDAGFEVVAFTRSGRRAPLQRSRLVRVYEITAPEVSAVQSKDELKNLLARLTVESRPCVLLPLDDAAVWLCQRINEPRWTLAGPAAGAAALALEKTRQVETACRAGFDVPRTVVANTPENLRSAQLGFPIIIRPANAVFMAEDRLQKGKNWICSNETEVDQAILQWRGRYPVLVQPYVDGSGEGVFGLATAAGVSAWSSHRRIRMMNPHGSGSSACASQAPAADVQTAAARFIDQSGWRGLFMIELLRDTNGRPWFVEFNGRPWGSMALSRRLGFEYPAWAVRAAFGEAIGSAPVVSERVVACRNVGREAMHLLFVLRGPKSTAIATWPGRWRTVRDLMTFHRGDQLYNWRRDDPLVWFSDTWCTVRNNLFKSTN